MKRGMMIAAVLALLDSTASAQNREPVRQLAIEVLLQVENEKVPLASTEISVKFLGINKPTDDNGLVLLNLPDSVEPGQELTVIVRDSSLSIVYPSDGKIVVPRFPTRAEIARAQIPSVRVFVKRNDADRPTPPPGAPGEPRPQPASPVIDRDQERARSNEVKGKFETAAAGYASSVRRLGSELDRAGRKRDELKAQLTAAEGNVSLILANFVEGALGEIRTAGRLGLPNRALQIADARLAQVEPFAGTKEWVELSQTKGNLHLILAELGSPRKVEENENQALEVFQNIRKLPIFDALDESLKARNWLGEASLLRQRALAAPNAELRGERLNEAAAILESLREACSAAPAPAYCADYWRHAALTIFEMENENALDDEGRVQEALSLLERSQARFEELGNFEPAYLAGNNICGILKALAQSRSRNADLSSLQHALTKCERNDREISASKKASITMRASAKQHLAGIHRILAGTQSGAEKCKSMQRARSLYEEALALYAGKNLEIQTASILSDLGQLYGALFECAPEAAEQEKLARLTEEALTEAITLRGESGNLLDVLRTQINIVGAYVELSQKSPARARDFLGQAISLGQAALETCRESRFEVCSQLEANLASAYYYAAPLQENESLGYDYLRRAASLFRQSFNELSKRKSSQFWLTALLNWSAAVADLDDAVLQANEPLELQAILESPEQAAKLSADDLGSIQGSLGGFYLRIAQLTSGPPSDCYLAVAEHHFQQVLAGLAKEARPVDWAFAKANLGHTHYLQAGTAKTRDLRLALLVSSRAEFLASSQVFWEQGRVKHFIVAANAVEVGVEGLLEGSGGVAWTNSQIQAEAFELHSKLLAFESKLPPDVVDGSFETLLALEKLQPDPKAMAGR